MKGAKSNKFWWIMSLGGLVVTSIIIMLITNLPNQEEKEQQRKSDSVEQIVKEEAKKVNNSDMKSVDQGGTLQSIKDVISEFHAYYNKTLGYGEINTLEWDQQRNKAKAFIQLVEEFEGAYEGTLITDLGKAVTYATNVSEGSESTAELTAIHRILHDLDIALNDYKDYKKVWGVTETLKQ